MKIRIIPSLFVPLLLISVAGMSANAEDMKLPMIHGEVKKVDESAGKLTIKHDAITNLDMGAMTMVFKANDPAMLKDIKPGESVVFTADKINGQITVMSVEKAK